MLNKLILPVIGLSGLVISFLFLRKTRNKVFLWPLIIYVFNFVFDIAVDHLALTEATWLVPAKIGILTMGGATLLKAYWSEKK